MQSASRTPAAPHAGRADPALADPGAPSCSLWYIQLRLGRHDYAVRRMCRYVTVLIAEHDFPTPFPCLRRGRLATDVCDKSRWPRDAVDAWLRAWLPPSAGASLDAAAQSAAAREMDGRAAQLTLVRGSRA